MVQIGHGGFRIIVFSKLGFRKAQVGFEGVSETSMSLPGEY